MPKKLSGRVGKGAGITCGCGPHRTSATFSSSSDRPMVTSVVVITGASRSRWNTVFWIATASATTSSTASGRATK